MSDVNPNVEPAVTTNTDPAELVSASPNTLLPKRREVTMRRPGNINIAGDRGNYPGCRLVSFHSISDVRGLELDDSIKYRQQLEEARAVGLTDSGPAAGVNLYFKHRANMLVVSEHVDSAGIAHIMVTNQLEDEDLEDFMEWSKEWEAHSAERKEKRQAQRRQEAEDKQKKEVEVRALAELGKKVRDHNLLKKLEEQADEIDRLKKALRKLEKN